MAQTRKPPIRPTKARLQAAFMHDLPVAWERSRSLRSGERPYAFVLYGVEGGLYPTFTVHVLTEEGLDTVARRYVEQGNYATIDEAREKLRWSVADSPHFAELGDHSLPEVDRVYLPWAKRSDLGEAGYLHLGGAAMAAMKVLDRRGIFGNSGRQRSVLLLVDTSFAGVDLTSKSMKALNPREHIRRAFPQKKALKLPMTACDEFFVSDDGRRVVATVATEKSVRTKGSAERSLSGYELGKAGVRRMWRVAANRLDLLAFSPDGKRIFTTTWREGPHEGEEKYFLQVRDGTSGRLLDETRLEGRSMFGSVSSNGTVFAALLLERALEVFSISRLERIGKFALGGTSNTMTFIDSRRAVVRVEERLTVVDVASPKKRLVRSGMKLGPRSLARSAGGKWVAAAEINPILLASPSVAKSASKSTRRGARALVFRASPFRLMKRIAVPGISLSHTSISADGRVLCAHGDATDSAHKFVVTVDVNTGKELGRFRRELQDSAVVLPDGTGVLIGTRGHLEHPFRVWRPGTLGSK